MNIKVNKRILTGIIIQIVLLLLSDIYLVHYDRSFVNQSRIGALFVLLSFILYCVIQKTIFTVANFYLLLFILFQFGLPIAYIIGDHYHNYYIELFPENLLVNAVKYTVIAIQVYTLFSSITVTREKNNYSMIKGGSKWTRNILNHKDLVTKAALWMFIITGIVSVPVNLISAINALRSGIIISNQFRGAMSENGIGRALQQFYFPSALLFLCFSRSDRKKKVVTIFYIIVALAMIVVADRAGGVSALTVYAFYRFNESSSKQREKRIFLFFCADLSLIIVSVIVARYRITGNIDSSISGNYFAAALEEMGFNFTSLCFVMDYIPSKTSFRYGMSYLIAVVLLIPKTLGLSSVYPTLISYLGETWLYNANNIYGRSYLSFGVGFSLIAESYYNFGWWGILMMIPLSFMVTIGIREYKYDDKWHTYMRLALMLSFFTLPRRQFAEALKSLEYTVFFMMLFLQVYINIHKRRIEMKNR